MFDFLIRKSAVSSAQSHIDRLNPKVQIHIHPEAPLPSIGLVKRLSGRAAAICALEPAISALSDEQLKAKTAEFKAKITQTIAKSKAQNDDLQERYRRAQSAQEREDLGVELKKIGEELFDIKQKVLDDILNEAFAVVREAGKRVRNMRHFDVQLVGGMVLHEGNISEMTTGEGKTLVATLPAYLNALTGDGVHIVTVNDYLALRDRNWMGPIFESLGLTVGCIQHDMSPPQRQQSYNCDVTYGTNNEFGFDYLRDNMVSAKEEMVQQLGHAYAIVDEVDSILVDEARTPLIISGPAEESTDKYYKANQISRELKGRLVTEAQEVDAKHKGEDLSTGFDYVADEKNKTIAMTEQGEAKAAQLFGVKNLHDIETVEYRHHVVCSLRAKEFFRRDVDYVVKEGKVIIVDEFTGRMMPGRRWSDGLHQAVEAREGIKIERETQTLATITFQNYFRMYDKLSGMTGTAYTEANEFKQIYNLDVVVIPTNRPLIRQNYPDCIYKTQEGKYKAVVADIEAAHQKGQPVLVGTISIERSEIISGLLRSKGIPHQVLNAKFHEMEAHIIAQAGRHKQVTIATNMAGRGTDIMLGGNAEYLARALAAEKNKNAEGEEHQAMVEKFISQFKDQVAKEKEQVLAAGGLYVMGTERHESRRIDNQLRGRCGRQGDPGATRFYVSLQDDLMRLFASDRIMLVMDKLGLEEDQVIESRMVSGALEVAQKRVENYNFEIRKQLLEYDNVMNKQREVIYSLRRSILEGENLKDVVLDAIASACDDVLTQHLELTTEGERNLETLAVDLLSRFSVDIRPLMEQLTGNTSQQIKDDVQDLLMKAYEFKEQQITPDMMRRLERMVLLHVIDNKWKDHLHAMDHIKDGISLRALGQRDPLVEYKKEGFAMFKGMYASINQEVATLMFKLEPSPDMNRPRSIFSDIDQKAVHQEFSGLPTGQPGPPGVPPGLRPPTTGAPPASTPLRSNTPKVGRNDPCPCGSGKKYKKCCGQ